MSENHSPSEYPNLNLNEDVLHEIMLYLVPKEMAVAALVCTCWTASAQQFLYRSITYHIPSTSSSEKKLIAILGDHPHLRALVRQITIYASTHMMEKLQWLHLFPAHSLRNVTYVCWPRNAFNPDLFDVSAVCTVPHLTANGPLFTEHLAACLALPNMVTLELDLTDFLPARLLFMHDHPRLPLMLEPARAPCLRDLYIYVARLPEPQLPILLAAFAPQLRSLHVHVGPGQSLQPLAEWEACATEFVKYARTVPKVVFSGFARWRPFRVPPFPGDTPEEPHESTYHQFLDLLVGEHSAVEHLGCISGLYSAALFQRLSRGLKVLELFKRHDLREDA